MTLHAALQVFLWLLGLCVGSFLNVVVYRLPAGLSVSQPRRSFCPRCHVSIAWYDNVPLLSWFLLGGRCRHCGGGISVQYPLVEALTGLVFVLVYHLLFVAQTRAGTAAVSPWADLPLLLSWLALAAGLVACSAMDIVSYTVDVRVTNAVLGASIILHALWPRGEFLVPRAQGPGAAAALAAFAVSGLMLWWSLSRWRADQHERAGQVVAPGSTPADSPTERLAGQGGAVVLVVLAGWLVYATAAADHPMVSQTGIAAALLAAFAVTVLVGGQQRPADDEIRAAIMEEQPRARQTAWRELRWLCPALVAGVAVLVAVSSLPGLRAVWVTLVGWQPWAGFVPAAGIAFAIHGAIVGALAGWVLRIVFTLAFGKEAFGLGDIYILAAAGAAAGWDIALLGLLLSVGVALLGWLFGLLLKRTAMIPFGPWLALGLLLALWWNRPAQAIAETYRDNLRFLYHEHPAMLPVVAGLMLVGTAAAIALSRLVRKWVAPDPP